MSIVFSTRENHLQIFSLQIRKGVRFAYSDLFEGPAAISTDLIYINCFNLDGYWVKLIFLEKYLSQFLKFLM